MERHVKERLIGAAVLMAAAVILIPEMLSGPERDEAPARVAANQTPLKTYTIDLNEPPGTLSTPEQPSESMEPIDERAPPPEAGPRAAQTDDPTAQSSETKPESDVGTKPATTEEKQSMAPPTAPAARAAAPPSAAPTLAPPPVVPTSAGWAVQIGSFSSQSRAERLAAELRAGGREAFVMPVRTNTATLYRVRVGPMKDRAGAEAALSALKASWSGAAVVAHP